MKKIHQTYHQTIFMATLSTLLGGLMCVQSAEAQQERGARFKFSPNIYKVEQARMPQIPDEPHNVTRGAMPQSAGFLGFDPKLMTKPAPPPPVYRQPATQVATQLYAPNATPNYNPAFGSPAKQPMVAQALPQLQAPLPMAAPNANKGPGTLSRQPMPSKPSSNSAPHYSRKSVSGRPHSVRTAVNGRLASSPRAVGQSAAPAAYSNGFGYTPGAYLPSQSGSGTNTRREVHGQVLRYR